MYYLAYGSNLHPSRLKSRVSSATYVGIIRISGYKLAFNKIGTDYSGKCNIEEVANSKSHVIFVLYNIDDNEKSVLDEYESLGQGYEVQYIDLTVEGIPITAFTYVAMKDYLDDDLLPFRWYKMLVLLGMEYFSFPGDYIEAVSKASAIPDNNLDRAKVNSTLIEELKANNRINATSKPRAQLGAKLHVFPGAVLRSRYF